LGNDVLDVRDVLVDYVQGSDVAGFVQLETNGGSTTVRVNADGMGTDFVQLATLHGVAGMLLNDMLAQGNLIVV
jgi:hypothetical protein